MILSCDPGVLGNPCSFGEASKNEAYFPESSRSRTDVPKSQSPQSRVPSPSPALHRGGKDGRIRSVLRLENAIRLTGAMSPSGTQWQAHQGNRAGARLQDRGASLFPSPAPALPLSESERSGEMLVTRASGRAERVSRDMSRASRRYPRAAVSRTRAVPSCDGTLRILQSLVSDADLSATLASVERVLTPGGVFGLDLVPELAGVEGIPQQGSFRGSPPQAVTRASSGGWSGRIAQSR